MSGEKKEDYEKQMLIDSLEGLPARVVAMAYLYALNYELYGVDVTEKWQTATENTLRLEMAYMRGRSDEIQCSVKIKPSEATPKSPPEMLALFEPELVQLAMQPEPVQQTTRPEITHEQAIDYLQSTGWMQEHDRQMMLDGVRKLTVRTEPHEIGYDECANALLKMRMDGVLTDGEYYRIANILNAKWGKVEPPKP